MATLITNSKFKQFDANGEPLASGKVYTYIVGTTTNKVTYQDEDLTTPNTNPIILDAWGEATIWIDGDTKLYVTDSNDAEIRTYDSFSDSGSNTGETPVISSPDDAVLRSTSTETGYIKIQLPMGEWPNTKMMFDVNVYQDVADESFKLNVSGFANSATTSWETTTAITNGKSDIAVQFGNDGTYPCVYIGAVDSEWVKPQIAISNFLAGSFSYDWDTWNDGWSAEITTSLGTITDTKTALGFTDSAYTSIGTDPEEIPLNSDLGTASIVDTGTGDNNVPLGSDVAGDWQDVTFEDYWSASTGTDYPTTLQYRLILSGKFLEIRGICERTSSGGTTIFTLPEGYRPVYTCINLPIFVDINIWKFSVYTDGTVYTPSITAGNELYFNHIIPLD